MVGRSVVVACALFVVACGKGSAPIEAEHAPARAPDDARTPLVVSSPTTRAALPQLPAAVEWSGHFSGDWIGKASPTTGHTYGHVCDLTVQPGARSGEIECNGWQMGIQATFRAQEREGRLDLFAVTSSGGPPLEAGRWFASITNRSGKLFYTWVYEDKTPKPEDAQPSPLRRLPTAAR